MKYTIVTTIGIVLFLLLFLVPSSLYVLLVFAALCPFMIIIYKSADIKVSIPFIVLLFIVGMFVLPNYGDSAQESPKGLRAACRRVGERWARCYADQNEEECNHIWEKSDAWFHSQTGHLSGICDKSERRFLIEQGVLPENCIDLSCFDSQINQNL